LRRDYPRVLELALQRLAPAGLLLSGYNTQGKPYPLAKAVASAADAVGARIEELPPPPLGDDLPQLAGFPEGRPHRMVAVRRI
jgi:23S rRNA G2069 N7-methylase RlmK/C1962 C5-methylase RlmI